MSILNVLYKETCFEVSVVLLRDTIFVIRVALVKFATDREMYVKVTGYLRYDANVTFI